jgi:uncharacterized protein (TIGR02391 family)
MLLTDDEMRLLRQAVEVQSGLDPELAARCSSLVHIQAYDEAVRNAFVLVEERLRKLLNPEKQFGVQLIENAFGADGYFSKQLSDNKQEADGLRYLLLGAFKLYRNPTAHNVVGYSAAESRAAIYLVDIILKKLDQVASMPKEGILPNNVQQVLVELEAATNAQIARRVKTFLGKCVKEGLQPRASSKQWISFRKYALVTNVASGS